MSYYFMGYAPVTNELDGQDSVFNDRLVTSLKDSCNKLFGGTFLNFIFTFVANTPCNFYSV